VQEIGYRSICERSTRNAISRCLRDTRQKQGRARGTAGIVNTTPHVGGNTQHSSDGIQTAVQKVLTVPTAVWDCCTLEEAGTRLLQNVGNHWPTYITPQATKPYIMTVCNTVGLTEDGGQSVTTRLLRCLSNSVSNIIRTYSI
jgi:hypothetical protein